MVQSEFVATGGYVTKTLLTFAIHQQNTLSELRQRLKFYDLIAENANKESKKERMKAIVESINIDVCKEVQYYYKFTSKLVRLYPI